MKKYPTFVLTLTALLLLFMLGRFLVRQANRGEWTVEVEREDAPSASVSAESGWPDLSVWMMSMMHLGFIICFAYILNDCIHLLI